MAIKYVDPNHPLAANNPAGGTIDEPFLDPNYAISRASTGDEIWVAPVEYDLSATLYTYLNINKGVTLKTWEGREGKWSIINAQVARAVYALTISPIVVDGLEFDHTGTCGVEVKANITSMTLRNCSFTGTHTLGLLRPDAGVSGLVVESTCTLVENGAAILYDYGATSYTIQPGTSMTVGALAAANGVFVQGGAGGGGTITIGGDLLLNCNMKVVQYLFTDANTVKVDGLNVTGVTAAYTRAAFEIRNKEGGVAIANSDLDFSLAVSMSDLITIQSRTGVVPSGNIEVYNNQLKTGAIGYHTIMIGDEGGVNHVANTYSGKIKVYGNALASGRHYGNPGVDTQHQIFVGYDINAEIYNNTVITGGYGVVIKGETPWTSGFVRNNYVQDATYPFYSKGVAGVRYVNNLSEDLGSNAKTMQLGAHGTGFATDTIAANNIFIVVAGKAVDIEAGCNSGNEFINNRYIFSSTSPFATVAGVDYNTFAQYLADNDFEEDSELLEYIRLEATKIVESTSNEWEAGIVIPGVIEYAGITFSGGNEVVINDTFIR